MIGYSVPIHIAAQGWGDSLGRYGPYGPPFQDRKLQATYIAEAKKLAESSAFITESTARQLIASVMNAGMAAGDSMVPVIEGKVRRAAKTGVGQMFLGGIAVAALGLSTWALFKRRG